MNKAYRVNVSGVGGIIFIIALIAIGFLAISFFLVFIGIVIALFLIGFIIRKILSLLRIKKDIKTTTVEHFEGKVIEEPDYRVLDNNEPDEKEDLN
jgi:hypothetical protein